MRSFIIFFAFLISFLDNEMSGMPPDTAQVTPIYSYKVIHSYPHDPSAFTQGLIFHDGYLYESTGQYGHSSLRKVELETGAVLEIHQLSAEYFGEGITLWDNKIYQLTWQSYTGFVYDAESFLPLENFYYDTEGWGIIHSEGHFVVSDGSSFLSLLDVGTFEEIGKIEVKDNEKPVANINELEWVAGEIFANILPTDRIARIDPQTGKVIGWINLSGLLGAESKSASVLNGIAYDSENSRLFVTGKLWPKLFEIEVTPPQ
jgi:glutaminyl-peptide cyclotransferase